MKFLCRLMLSVFLAGVTVKPLPAQENDFWINPGGGFYISFVNWGDETRPGPLDTANFDLSSLYDVDWIDNYSPVAALNISSGNVLFRSLGSDTGGPVYEMTVSGDVNVSDSTFFIGFGNESHCLSIGDHLIVSDARMEVLADSTLSVNSEAEFGDGSVFAVGDSVMNAMDNVLFGIGAGALTDDTWVEIRDGANFNVGGFIDVGSGADSAVVMDVDGGSLATDSLGLYVGAFANSSGELNVAGSGSMWSSDSTIRVGWAGSGVLNIENEAVVTGESVIVGELSGSTGTVSLTGQLSTLSSGTDIQVGQKGDAEINLSDASSLSAAGQILIGSTGAIEVDQPGLTATISAGAGLVNNGLLDLRIGSPIIDANVINFATIRSTSGSITAINGSLRHDGVEIFTTSSSEVRISGPASGVGPYTGMGTTRFQADVEPGLGDGINAIASIPVAGNVEMISDTITQIEIQGLPGDEFDRLLVAGDVELAGQLNVYDFGHAFATGDEFVFIEVGGTRTGEFDGLPEGAFVNSFGGVDLMITYTAGDGNDVALITDSGTVLLGDVNLDGSVNLLDIAPFVELVSGGGFQVEADINQDGAVNLLDVSGFIDLIAG